MSGTEAKELREMRRKLESQTDVIEALYKQMAEALTRIEALEHGKDDRRGTDRSDRGRGSGSP